MNLELFNELMKIRPSQHLPEFRTYLELCELYLKRMKIINPLVVELGIYNNAQKKFYEQLLNAEHIGVDASNKRSEPDILGNTHDTKTLKALKEKLNGRPIDILFIDAGHEYEDIKKDYKMYAPLCSGIVALHDTELRRNTSRTSAQVWRFWDELKEKGRKAIDGHEDYLFVSLHQRHYENWNKNVGLGIIIKQ